MSKIPDHLRYAPSHEWISLEGSFGTVGITDHAQNALSDVVYVDLPKVGTATIAGAAIAVIESVKAASDIYSPMSGKVVEINSALNKAPELINQDAYAAWLFRIEISKPEELDNLKDAASYEVLLGA